MANEFVYNPAQSIKQEFGDISSGLGDIFKQVIEQKQRDYKLAEDVYVNIEALKDKVNMYGRQDITNKANQLVGDLADAIGPDGKVNSALIAGVKAKASRIKQEKQAWEDKAELRKEYQTRLLSQKDLVPNMEKAMMDLDKITMDPRILNAQDASKYYEKAFKNNLDASQLFHKSYTAYVRPEGSINGIVTNKDKSAITFAGKGYQGDSYDPITKKRIRPAETPALDPTTGAMVMRPTVDVDYEKMEAASPSTIDLLIEQNGAAAQMIPEAQRRKAIFNMYADKLPYEIKETFVKPPKVANKKEVAPTMSTKPFKITLPDGQPANAIPAGRKVIAQISPTQRGIITGIAKSANGDYYGQVNYKKGTEVVWDDEVTIPEGGLETRWTKITTPKDEFEKDLGASSINAYKGKLGAQFVVGFKSLPKPKGGAPTPEKTPAATTPAPPKNPAAKVSKGSTLTEGMVYAIMQKGGFKETREQVINRLSK